MNAPFRPPTWSAATQTDPLSSAAGIYGWFCIMAALWAAAIAWALS